MMARKLGWPAGGLGELAAEAAPAGPGRGEGVMARLRRSLPKFAMDACGMRQGEGEWKKEVVAGRTVGAGAVGGGGGGGGSTHWSYGRCRRI